MILVCRLHICIQTLYTHTYIHVDECAAHVHEYNMFCVYTYNQGGGGVNGDDRLYLKLTSSPHFSIAASNVLVSFSVQSSFLLGTAHVYVCMYVCIYVRIFTQYICVRSTQVRICVHTRIQHIHDSRISEPSYVNFLANVFAKGRRIVFGHTYIHIHTYAYIHDSHVSEPSRAKFLAKFLYKGITICLVTPHAYIHDSHVSDTSCRNSMYTYIHVCVY